MNSQLREQERISSLIDNEADDCIKGYLQNDVITTLQASNEGSGLMIGNPISTTISNSIDSSISKVTTVEVLPHNYLMQLDNLQEAIQDLYDDMSILSIHHKLHDIENMIQEMRKKEYKLETYNSTTINTTYNPVNIPIPGAIQTFD